MVETGFGTGSTDPGAGARPWPRPACCLQRRLHRPRTAESTSSVSTKEFGLQLRGYRDAFLDPRVVDSIRGGPVGAIAVIVIMWAGDGEIRTITDWTRIEDAESAALFAAKFAETPRYLLPDGTSLGTAIGLSHALFAANPAKGGRQVIDISGDGPSNVGRHPTEARDLALAAGITINGLPILMEHPDLDFYFSENVVGGPGAFIVAAENFQVFSAAILNKLVNEIAGTVPQPADRRFASTRTVAARGVTVVPAP